MATSSRARVVLADTPGVRRELASRAPGESFAGVVRRMVGYAEWTAEPLARRDYPSSNVMLVFDFGPPIRVAERDDGRSMRSHPGGFVAGLDDGAGRAEHGGFQQGVRVDLTPQGARRLFGLPMSALARRIVPLTEVLPQAHRSLIERLRELADWDARFDVIEQVLSERLAVADSEHYAVAWLVSRIEASAGRADVGELVRELGYSHKHTLRLFLEHVGLTPKLFARLVRFASVRQSIASSDQSTNLAELAARFDYSDQAHLAREVRHFAGRTPTRLRADAVARVRASSDAR